MTTLTRQERCVLLHDTALLPELPDEFFSLPFWESRGGISGQAQGRGVTWFLEYEGLSLVWRRYRRGGLIGKFLKQHFLLTTISRAEQEFLLLRELQALGLPVPAPVAACVTKGWLFYQAEIMTLRIPDAQDLVAILQQQALPDDDWRAIGQLVARFHQHQVYHSDLNSHNILQDRDGKLWLIDFDKCGFREGESWKLQNLARLKRSFEKEARLFPEFHFEARHWQLLLEGYQALV